jgi:hypothetical protein
MISEDNIVEQLRQLPNGNAVALCVSFIADTIYPGEDESSIEKSFEFMDEVRALIYKHRQEANNDDNT